MTDKTPTTLTTADVAAKLDTDPKTLRRFLRSPESMVGKVGQGSRYSFTPREVASLKSRFVKWSAAQPAKRVRKVIEPKSPTEPKSPKTRSTVKAEKAAKGAARAEALDNALKAHGAHVSQHVDS